MEQLRAVSLGEAMAQELGPFLIYAGKGDTRQDLLRQREKFRRTEHAF
jgi:hypothetical protein